MSRPVETRLLTWNATGEFVVNAATTSSGTARSYGKFYVLVPARLSLWRRILRRFGR